jgi:5-dehydro-2-deoxygluconokinase
MSDKHLDIICLGRAAVDLYGEQFGGRLEDMQSFAKYLGGSSGNLAAGLGRLGVRSAMLTRVGNDHMGRFVREQLQREGVDVSAVRTDPDRLTGLVILGIGPNGEVPHIFFRERCADMGLTEDDVDETFIASSRALAVTGTHLSTPTTRKAVHKAMRAAKNSGGKVIFDIDYRPVLWGLTVAGDGASRYVASSVVTSFTQEVLHYCDLIIGTEEEISIAGGTNDLLRAVRNIRSWTNATIVLKRGASGCTVLDAAQINSLEDGIVIPGFPVEVFNTVGAGDAFLSGFLRAWLDEKSWEECGKLGNACGAVVVTRHGCTPAMPGPAEIEYFMGSTPLPDPRRDERMNHLHRAALWKDDPRPLCVLAFDHRSQFEDLVSAHDKPVLDAGRFKMLLTETLLDFVRDGDGSVRYGAIIDHRHGQAALDHAIASGFPLWTAAPIEMPGSRPLEFDPPFGAAEAIASWPRERIIKCLAFYHPDDAEELRMRQEQKIQDLYANLVALDRRIVLEVICPNIGASEQPDALPRALQRLYDLGIRPDWWKLKGQSAEGWSKITDVIRTADPHCKGVVVLGLGAEMASLLKELRIAAGFDICRGFAVGRSIFHDAASDWFAGRVDDAGAKALVKERYRLMIEAWVSGLPRQG